MGALLADTYEGDEMHACLLTPFDFKQTYVVVVSGAKWNPCGHTILNTGGGWYFHVAGPDNVPRFMREPGYLRYLKENGKREIRRSFLKIPNPIAAHRKLEELLAKRWLWLGLPHNCAAFLEEIVQAGGSKAGLYFNCPTIEEFR
ncbi:MAG: hypothetical protein V4754_05285 [Pseudomonadota bacterium]